MDPPGRNAMWRFGYPTPVNYDDTQLWCGNAATLEMNGGKCGVCGDNYADPVPREHEAGGKYGLGVVVRRYSKGQPIETEIELTANHWGHFEFRVCPVPDATQEITQECLDQKRHDTMIIITLTGCGPQETFRNCADIAILTNTGGQPPVAQVPPKNMVLVRDNKSGHLVPLVVRSQVCTGAGTYDKQPGIDNWCQENCMRYPPNCPEDKCKCIHTCEAVGSFSNQTGSDVYCLDKCMVYPTTKCDNERCQCF
ncbi:unnamed protein product [Orchesella dallaii]|uniref:Chitin-binding type-4 domain-containing protein n=1 Tax=Orchesella dallaii TaxID=48710 RepID=A0ABP1RNC1_9HEXA